MWCHLPTGFQRRSVLITTVLLAMFIAFFTTLYFAMPAQATAGINQTMHFQARLLRASGTVVPDGYYNVQFKLYQDGTGTTAGNTGGTLVWTENYVNNGGTSGVKVKNGLMSVELGSNNPFGTSVDWNQDTIWLSMNIAGSDSSCTTFNSGSCLADGEMLPMKRLTSSPYAMNAGKVGGKSSSQLVQLSQGVQEDAANNASSIFINKTGLLGDYLRFQNGGTDALRIGSTGDIKFGSNANHQLIVDTAAASEAGKQLTIRSGSGGSGSGSSGGDLVLQAGDGGGTDGGGGNVSIDAGAKTGSGTGGTVAIGSTHAVEIRIGSFDVANNQTISIGANNTSGSSTDVNVGSGGSASSGTTTIQAKDSVVINTNGTTRATFSDSSDTVFFGNGSAAIVPNNFKIQGTNSIANGAAGGSLTIQGGDATTGDTDGGDVTLSGGSGAGAGNAGLVVMTTPTFSTVTQDANCYTSGAPVASSCTIAASTINSNAAVLVGFSTTGQTATLPDPTNQRAGRIHYVMASGSSEPFTLSMNGGGNVLTLRADEAATLVWNGTDWVAAGTSSSTVLQDVYNSDNAAKNVTVGSGSDDSTLNLFTLDKAASAPTITDNALLGSMYFDTTLGKVQCYEADGWGACGASPDTFITISPEYTNAVMNGADIGTISSDICSDQLNINDGSSSQPTICGTDETYNFYNWTSAETSAQTRSIYVTYQLPDNFKEFVSSETDLLGRTDSSDADVSYKVYRDSANNGLITCGSTVAVSTGSQTSWQTGTASSGADPSTCGFVGGESLLVRIDLTSANDANAYVSNLKFVYSTE